jgi:hypothetical protein
MKFDPITHMGTLIPINEFLESKACSVMTTRRRVYYRGFECRDRSFMDANCVIMLASRWFAFPAAIEEWHRQENERSQARYENVAA